MYYIEAWVHLLLFTLCWLVGGFSVIMHFNDVPFVTGHSFLASFNGPKKDSWNPTRQLGMTTYNLEIRELKFGKKMACFALHFKALYSYDR